MVTKATRWRLILYMLLCVSSLMWTNGLAGELNMRLQQHRIELGQVINARLIATETEADLAEVDLNPLYQNFAVIVADNVRSDSQRNLQTLNVELYPRRTGSLTVPALSLGEMKSREQTVLISNAMVGETATLVNLTVSGQKVWQRQQVLAAVEIKSAHRFFNITLEPFKLKGFEVRPFVAAREPIDGDPHYRSRIRVGWSIFPLVSGAYTLELPMLKYEQGGLTQRRFFLPRIDIQVRELPQYIPPNMPVAKVHIASSIVTSGLLRTGHLAYWNIILSAEDTLAYWLPPVLHNIQSSNQIEYLPAKSRPDLQIDAGGALAQVIHEVPFKARRMGSIELPRLKVQYFDPDTGRIESVYHDTPPPIAWSVPVIILCTVLVIILSVWGSGWFFQHYRHHKQRQSALLGIREAQAASEILLGLRHYAVAEGWPFNLTVSEFGGFWQQRYCVSTKFSEQLQILSQQLYGGGVDLDLEKLKTGLLQHLRRPQRRHRPSANESKNPVWDRKNIFIRP